MPTKTKAEDTSTSKAPTAEDDRNALREQKQVGFGNRFDPGRDPNVKVNPKEAETNDADWASLDPKQVVEVEGQRETVAARLARNGVYSPEHKTS